MAIAPGGDDQIKELLRKKAAGAARADRESLMRQVEAAAREVEQARQEIQAKNTLLQQMILERDRFIGMAAHDLRNPLSVVSGYAELLSDDLAGKVPDEDLGLLQDIMRASQRMLGLVEGILDVTSIARGKIVLHYESFPLDQFTQELSQGYTLLARQKGVPFSFTSSSSMVTTDRLRLSQIVDNLMSNALKFSSRGFPVSLDASLDREEVVVTVSDHGPGMSREETDRLFNYFQTGVAKSTAGEKSYGLGLAIIRSLVEAMEGNIAVKSQPGAGTTFTVHIPDWGRRL